MSRYFSAIISGIEAHRFLKEAAGNGELAAAERVLRRVAILAPSTTNSVASSIDFRGRALRVTGSCRNRDPGRARGDRRLDPATRVRDVDVPSLGRRCRIA